MLFRSAALSIAQFDKQLKTMDAQINQLNSVANLNQAKADTEKTVQGLNVQQHDFLKEYNEERLRLIDQQIAQIGYANYNAWLQGQLHQRNITRADIAIIRDGLAARLDRLGIRQRRQDLIAGRVAIGLGRAQIQELRHNLQVATQKGWPVGSWNNLQVMADAIRDGMTRIGNMWNVPTPEFILDKLQQLGNEAIDVLTGTDDPNDSRVKQIFQDVVGYIPPVAVIRWILNRIKKGRATRDNMPDDATTPGHGPAPADMLMPGH